MGQHLWGVTDVTWDTVGGSVSQDAGVQLPLSANDTTWAFSISTSLTWRQIRNVNAACVCVCASPHVASSAFLQANETERHLKLIALSGFINANCSFLLNWLACVCLLAETRGSVKERHTPFVRSHYVKTGQRKPEISPKLSHRC